MKAFISAILLVMGTLGAQAGGYYYGHHHWSRGPSVSFYYGAYPGYAPSFYWSDWAYPSYPAYGAYPAYPSSRPNYAVSGTLLGALTGGLIGNSIHHQGWEGAGIGAAAGLVLGSLAEHNARAYEPTYSYASPPIYYAQPNRIASGQTVSDPPVAPAAPQVQGSTQPRVTSYRSAGAMRGANSLFGR